MEFIRNFVKSTIRFIFNAFSAGTKLAENLTTPFWSWVKGSGQPTSFKEVVNFTAGVMLFVCIVLAFCLFVSAVEGFMAFVIGLLLPASFAQLMAAIAMFFIVRQAIEWFNVDQQAAFA